MRQGHSLALALKHSQLPSERGSLFPSPLFSSQQMQFTTKTEDAVKNICFPCRVEEHLAGPSQKLCDKPGLHDCNVN